MRSIDADALLKEYDRVHVGPPGGARKLIEDAPTVGGWISVKDMLPEEHESIFSRFKGSERWSKAMWVMESKIVLVVAAMPDKWSTVTTGNLHDGKWCTRIPPMIDYKVTHWMPLPEPPKEDNNEGS